MQDRCICSTLRQVAAQSTAHYDAVLAPSGIKVTMFRLLRQIDAAKSVSITELAEGVGLDRSTLGRNLRVLEKQSLVAIGSGFDGRTRVVALTDSGRAKLQEVAPLWQAAQQSYSELIGPDMLSLLDHVIDQTSLPNNSTGSSE